MTPETKAKLKRKLNRKAYVSKRKNELREELTRLIIEGKSLRYSDIAKEFGISEQTAFKYASGEL